MGRRLRFYRRIREALINVNGKSNERIIADCTMVAPLASDKGSVVSTKNNSKKRSLKSATIVKKSGKGNKSVKF